MNTLISSPTLGFSQIHRTVSLGFDMGLPSASGCHNHYLDHLRAPARAANATAQLRVSMSTFISIVYPLRELSSLSNVLKTLTVYIVNGSLLTR